MSQIPAPLLSRHLAIVVVVVSLLAVAVSVATLLIPIDGSVLGLVVVRQVVLAVQCGVLAVAVGVVWLTLVRRTRSVVVAAVAAVGGFLLLALVQLATIVVPTAWGIPVVILIIELVALLAAVLLVPGLLVLGVAVIRRGAWTGPTTATLIVGAVLVVPIVVTQVLHGALAIPYGIFSLAFLGLAVGLRERREVPVYGLPDTQLGAARV